MTTKFRPRPARLTLRQNGAPVFRLRLEQDQSQRVLDALRLLRAGTAHIVGKAPQDALDVDIADCLCALIEQEFGSLRQEETWTQKTSRNKST